MHRSALRVGLAAPPSLCPSGGVVVLSGQDLDGDGSLADAEIATTVSHCDEIPPAPRTVGAWELVR